MTRLALSLGCEALEALTDDEARELRVWCAVARTLRTSEARKRRAQALCELEHARQRVARWVVRKVAHA